MTAFEPCRAKLLADLCRPQGIAALETFLRPMVSAIVILFHRGHSRWEHNPGLLQRGEYVDVRRKPIRLIERADANKAQGIACSGVVAPEGDMALRTARYFLTLAAVRRRVHDFDFALQQAHSVSFDERIKRERRSGFSLTPAAMTTVNEHRLARHPITHAGTCAAAIQRKNIVR